MDKNDPKENLSGPYAIPSNEVIKFYDYLFDKDERSKRLKFRPLASLEGHVPKMKTDD